MNPTKLTIVLAAIGLAVAACGGSNTVPSDTSTSTVGSGPAMPTGGNNGPGSTTTTGFDDPEMQTFREMFPDAPVEDMEFLMDLVVYFEFDSSEIRSDFNEQLAAHGRVLAASPDRTVRLEGHADERGSREYNIGLGERRAQAVRQILLLGGASASQLSTVSYGEERPAVFGSDEEAWSLNRRVEIVYD